MSEFNPYLNWLGIRNSSRSLHHYPNVRKQASNSPPAAGLDAVLKVSTPWYFKTSAGNSFRTYFYPDKIRLVGSVSGTSRYVKFGRVGDLLIAPVEEQNSMLFFSLRPGAAVQTIDFKRVDASSGRTYEMGLGSKQPAR